MRAFASSFGVEEGLALFECMAGFVAPVTVRVLLLVGLCVLGVCVLAVAIGRLALSLAVARLHLAIADDMVVLFGARIIAVVGRRGAIGFAIAAVPVLGTFAISR